MPSFQTESLLLAESKLAGSVRTGRFLRLYRAFEASFLHYSRLTPDHWRHPRGTWTGFPDLPSCGSCVVLAILAHGVDPDEMAIRYHEFLGAMAARLSPDEAAFALLSAEASGRKHPDDPRFEPMIAFLRDRAGAPRTEDFLRAQRVARCIISTDQA